MYLKARGTEVDLTKPLNGGEVRKFTRCELHSFGAVGIDFNKRNEIEKMHRLVATCTILDRAIQRNAEQLQRELGYGFAEEQHQQKMLKRRIENRLDRGSNEDRGPVNKVLAEAMPPKEHHKRGRRKPAAMRRAAAYMLHDVPKESRKGKKGDNGKKQGGKRRK